MPFKTRKVRGKKCYTVYKAKGKRKVYSKCTTKKKAQKQLRLLRAIIFNKNFKPNTRSVGKTRKRRK
jgi:hypothetical protein